jgi:two-component system, cell cycle response regulator DivK
MFCPVVPSREKTILVVEDNYWNRKLMEVHLEMHGYTSVLATEGAAALMIAQERELDLILMDIQLPDISGIEAIRRLKIDARTRTIPIIAVTAFALPTERNNILASGCEAYISKPFKGEVLMKLVERYTS